jgi:hypothetical protein
MKAPPKGGAFFYLGKINKKQKIAQISYFQNAWSGRK